MLLLIVLTEQCRNNIIIFSEDIFVISLDKGEDVYKEWVYYQYTCEGVAL